jgi:LysR family transcriptional regulator, low CO2-responsive transcriptional regulator
MNDAQLRCFHMAAIEGNITKAAARLRISQPAVSNHIRALEQGYGVQLFRRVGRNVELTEFGRELRELTERLYSVQADVRDLLLSKRNVGNGHLRIGTVGPQQILPVLRELQARHPHITYGVRSGNSTVIRDALLRGDIDVGITTNLALGDTKTHIQFFRRDEVVLLVHRGHRLAEREFVAPSELAGETIIARELGSMTLQTFLHALAAVDVNDPRLIMMETREATQEAVARGFGVSPELRSMAGRDERYSIRRLGPSAPTLDMYVACPRSTVREPLIRAFLDAAHVVSESLERDHHGVGILPPRSDRKALGHAVSANFAKVAKGLALAALPPNRSPT